MAGFGARLAANRAAALARLAAAPAGAFPAGGAGARGRGAAGRGGAARRRCARAGGATWRRGGRWSGRTATISAAVYAAKGVPARLCSTGEQKALLISLVLANARAVAEGFGAAPVLLLDEVAAHLDAERRRALYDAVAGLGAQAWMTGTGAGALRRARRGRSGSRVRRGRTGRSWRRAESRYVSVERKGGRRCFRSRSRWSRSGSRDLGRARAFYAALGWEAAQAPRGGGLHPARRAGAGAVRHRRPGGGHARGRGRRSAPGR